MMLRSFSLILLTQFAFSFCSMASEEDLQPILPVSGYIIDFRDGANRDCLVSGWSGCIDKGGVRSDGNEANLVLTLPNKPSTDLQLTIDGPAFFALTQAKQEMELIVNGTHLSNLVYVTTSESNKEIQIPYETLTRGDARHVELCIKFKNTCIPLKDEVTPDTQVFGIYLHSLTFKEVFSFVGDFETPFEGVVTLGDFCGTKLQVEAFFKNHFPGQLKQYTGGRNLFDFVAIRDYGKLADAIGNKLVGCCEKDMIVKANVRPTITTYSPVDKYELNFPHLFDQHPIVKGARNLTQESFDKYFEIDVLSKITYLKKKFLSNRRRTLYIMWGVKLSYQTSFTEENILKLRNTLAAVRGNSNFCMLVLCSRDFGFRDQENIRYYTLELPSVEEMLELTPRFNEVLKLFKFIPLKITE